MSAQGIITKVKTKGETNTLGADFVIGGYSVSASTSNTTTYTKLLDIDIYVN